MAYGLKACSCHPLSKLCVKKVCSIKCVMGYDEFGDRLQHWDIQIDIQTDFQVYIHSKIKKTKNKQTNKQKTNKQNKQNKKKNILDRILKGR